MWKLVAGIVPHSKEIVQWNLEITQQGKINEMAYLTKTKGQKPTKQTKNWTHKYFPKSQNQD